MKKSAKKIILISIVSIILIAILGLAVTECFYLPRYWATKTAVESDDIDAEQIRLMSFNVRCWAPDDLGKKSWFYRAGLVGETLQDVAPDIIGFQEVTGMHYEYLQDILTGYDSIIQYRDNSFFSEGCPIFYRSDAFELIDKGSFWLSETPDAMSKDWGSVCYRICSYVILKVKGTDNKIAVFNTHLDHVSDLARINGIKVVLDKIEEYGSLPSVLMGDLNARPDSATYLSAVEYFGDSAEKADVSMSSGTYHNWGSLSTPNRIDYIMLSNNFEVTNYAVYTNAFDEVWPSDHYPIYTDVSIP